MRRFGAFKRRAKAYIANPHTRERPCANLMPQEHFALLALIKTTPGYYP
jgi:hypothetical protein